MGQQQLLLLVLATVIVGIAIAVGIVAFRENAVRSNYDALAQDAIRIANDVQAWKQKPAMFGGSPDGTKTDANNFVGVTLASLGYTNLKDGGDCYFNRNGEFDLINVGTDGLVIEAGNLPNNNYLQIEVTGLTDAAINPTTAATIRGGVDDGGNQVLPSMAGNCALAP